MSFDSLLNDLNKRCRLLQNKLTIAEVFLENQTLFHKLHIAVYDKQKLSRKRKLKENENDNKFGSCNMNLEDKKESKQTQKSVEFRTKLEMCLFCGKKDKPKNLHKCQPLELHNLVKKAVQNLNSFNLIAKLYEGDMVVSDADYHLNLLTSLYQQENKINRTQCE